MRSTTAIAFGALTLLQLVAAQPHRARHAHKDRHAKKDAGDVVVKVDHVVYAAPAVAPEVLVNVFVNDKGEPISTSMTTVNEAAATLVPWSTSAPPSTTPTPSPTSTTPKPTTEAKPTTSSSSSVYVPPPSSSSSVYVAPPSSSAAPATSSAASNPISGAVDAVAGFFGSGSGSSSSSTASGSGYGFAYSPYRSYGCVTKEQAMQDFALLKGQYSFVRIYGTDCDQINIVHAAAKANGMKVFAGVFDIDSVSDAIGAIMDVANGDFSAFHAIGVGNELVNDGTSPEVVIAALTTAKGLLGSNGPPVCIVDTMTAMLAHPEIANAGDIVCANDHPFFSGANTDPSDYGSFIQNNIESLKGKMSDSSKEILITETGHPHKGDSTCPMTVDAEAQSKAMSSIKASFSTGVYFLSSYDTLWKSSTANWGTERYWGFMNNGVPPSGA